MSNEPMVYILLAGPYMLGVDASITCHVSAVNHILCMHPYLYSNH
jgi:hypothetical protein